MICFQMSQLKESHPEIRIGKGCIQRFFYDPSKETSSRDCRFTLTIYDGELASEVPEVPSHWHKHHDEYVQVVEGRVTFVIDGQEKVVDSRTKEAMRIPRGVVHSFRFVEGVKTTVREMMEPSEDVQERLSRALYQTGSCPGLWAVARVALEGDMYLHLPMSPLVVDEAFTYTVGSLARYFAPPRLEYSNARHLPEMLKQDS